MLALADDLWPMQALVDDVAYVNFDLTISMGNLRGISYLAPADAVYYNFYNLMCRSSW
jgi:hypothetical protein